MPYSLPKVHECKEPLATSITLNNFISRTRKPELLPQVSFDDIGVSLDFSGQTLSDGTAKIKNQHTISNTHNQFHIVFHKHLSHAKLFFDIQNEGGDVCR